MTKAVKKSHDVMYSFGIPKLKFVKLQAYSDLLHLSEPTVQQQQMTAGTAVTGAAAAVNSSASKLLSSLWGIGKSGKATPSGAVGQASAPPPSGAS